VSFPDWPGVITAGDTIDEAMQQAAEILTFAAEDWESRDCVKGAISQRQITVPTMYFRLT
jgi:antitoxin HicB